MPTFYYDRLGKLDELLAASTSVYRSYADVDLDLARKVSSYLEEAQSVYEGFGSAAGGNELAELRAQFACARRGIDPVTQARVVGRRRELERSTALRVLGQSCARIRNDVARYVAAVEEARAQLRPAVLRAIQKGLIDVSRTTPLTQHELEVLWKAMSGDADISLTARNVAMHVSAADVGLLLLELIDAATGR